MACPLAFSLRSSGRALASTREVCVERRTAACLRAAAPGVFAPPAPDRLAHANGSRCSCGSRWTSRRSSGSGRRPALVATPSLEAGAAVLDVQACTEGGACGLPRQCWHSGFRSAEPVLRLIWALPNRSLAKLRNPVTRLRAEPIQRINPACWKVISRHRALYSGGPSFRCPAASTGPALRCRWRPHRSRLGCLPLKGGAGSTGAPCSAFCWSASCH